jgi:hypothetical protein
MTALMIASAVAWARTGMGVLRGNWELRPTDGSGIARSIFNGVCIGFLGVTGMPTPILYSRAYPNCFSKDLNAPRLTCKTSSLERMVQRCETCSQWLCFLTHPSCYSSTRYFQARLFLEVQTYCRFLPKYPLDDQCGS